MAKKKDLIEQFVNQKIQTDYLEKVMGERFGAYSKYIIQDRAIPDVRDGLKPVQRRILYAMQAVGMVAKSPYKKSARIVGEVIGKYHPHGDSSVYEALVRMSQDFKINVPLIDMHGNNGSIDGDSAAAMRYTEARLSEAAMYLLKDLEKKTVPFVPNYDDSEIEPVILPSKFPNLLVNGSDGIASGYATNIPPHNLAETINLTIARIKNPNLSYDEALEILPGPDFPTGGIIELTDDLRQALMTGKGKVVVRSKAIIEKNNIIITEIPYGVNKAQLVKKMDSVKDNKGVDGIIEVRDESDKEGLRIVIETKDQANTDVILNYLYKTTDLQINFSYNTVAIVDRSPKQLGILDIIDAYILHQKEIITNRSNFEMDKDQRRLHIVEGYHKLSSIVNEVVETIKSSKNKADAKDNLVKLYGFTELQAEAIVMLQLYRLTSTDIKEFEDERKRLEADIKRLKKILSDDEELKKVIIEELSEILEKIPSPRKTEIVSETKVLDIKEEELIIHEDVRVIITKDGYIKKMSLKAYQASIGVSVLGLKENDYAIFDEVCNTMDSILLFTTQGSYINIPVYKMPDLKYKELGAYIGSLFDLNGAERVASIIHATEAPKDDVVFFVATKLGKVKLVEAKEIYERRYKKGYIAKFSDDKDEIVNVSLVLEDMAEVIAITKFGLILKYPKSEIPMVGLKALGVKNISLKPGDEVIASFPVLNYYKEELLLLINRGTLKRLLLKNIVRSKRGGRGTPFLKNVKSNPYYFIKAVCNNPSKFKESIMINLVSDLRSFGYNGLDLPKDTFENGVQIFNNGETPIDIFIDIIDKKEYDKGNNELSKEFQKSIEEIKKENPNSLIDELGEIVEKQTSIYDFLGDDLSDDDEKLKDDLF
ncbi:MAG: DNA topoisomerase IV subunit A [Gammaproteobacteria bacterium]|nr:DNA topoisomerase IV subunit A [Gammaproteobacteria bacterium]